MRPCGRLDSFGPEIGLGLLTIGLRFGASPAISAAMRAGTERRHRQTGRDMMNADRTVLTDAMWARIKDMPPGRPTDPGATAADSRRFVEAVPVRFRTGSPWRDLPERFGNRDGVSRRFRRRALSGVSGRVSDALSEGSGPGWVSVDGTVVQAHRKAAGAEGGPAARGSAAPGAA